MDHNDEPEAEPDGDVALLRRIATFGALDADALTLLAAGAERLALAEGETLFRAGAAADCGYVLLSGRVELSDARRDGVRRAAQQVGPGALIGEIALIAATPRPGTAVALEPSRLLRITRADFLKLLERDPKAAAKLRRAIARRLEQMMKALDTVRTELERPRPAPRRR